jgi:hypothetical protein
MMNRKLVLMAALVVLAAVVMAVRSEATSLTITNKLTFSRAVALPGVVLAPGSYTFEAAPVGTRPDLVRVLRNSDGTVMFLGFTQIGRRPYNVPNNQVIALGETTSGQPAPIKAWYPVGSSTVHEFLW